MSTTIDQRVVEMRFDNKQFEREVSTTMTSLDKLRNSLDLDGATKGLENVNTAAGRVNLSGLGNAVDMVSSRFSALGIMGVTALVNITNSAVNAGKRIVSALTIDPIKTGFSEYETKINAIQTIMSNTASKGKTMEDVTKVLNELNAYADKTIYNFAEMTRNIGTFTAAGVGLEESAAAIQGIANLAAMSGSNSQQASTAMYQLSQAMASGTVKLMDWNSVVNAGMGGQLFQDALKETARAHGVAVDEIIEQSGSFRDSLREEWLTADILTETLSKMTKSGAAEYLSGLTGVQEDQIKAAQKLVAENKDGTASYEKLAEQLAATGKVTKEQAIDILKMADNAEDAATKVKTFTQLFDTLKESAQSGWAQTWEILIGDFEEAKETLTEFSNVIGDVINKSAEARNKVLQGWKDAGGRADIVDALFNVYEGIASIAKPIKEAFRDIFPPTTVKQLKGFSEGLKALTERFKLSQTASDNLKRTFRGLFAAVDIVWKVIKSVCQAIAPLFGAVGDLSGGILGFTGGLGDAIVEFNNFLDSSNALGKAAGVIAKGIDLATKGVKGFISVLKNGIVAPVCDLIIALFDRMGMRIDTVKDRALTMKDVMVGAFNAIAEKIKSTKIAAAFQTIWNVLKVVGAGIGKVLGFLIEGIAKLGESIEFNDILDLVNTASFAGLVMFIKNFAEGFTTIAKTGAGIKDGIVGILNSVKGCFEAYQSTLKAEVLKKIAVAIAILAASILVLSLIDSDKLMWALAGITTLFADLMGAMTIFSKISGSITNVGKAIGAMIGISVAALVMASALGKLAGFNTTQILNGLVGIVGITATLLIAATYLGKTDNTVIKGAVQMVVFATAINILASACAKISGLSWEELAKGLTGISVLLLAVAGFTRITGGAKDIVSTSVSLVTIAAAMGIFVAICKNMTDLSWVELGTGLLSMALALGAITLATRFMPTNMLTIGVGLVAVAGAIYILAEAFGKIGSMSWEGIAKGLGVLGYSIAILAAGLYVMSGTMMGSAALVVAAGAIALLTGLLAVTGTMSWETIAKGLVALAGGLAIIAGAGYLLTPVVPAILSLGGAFAMVGAAAMGIGIGLALAGVGLSAIATGLSAIALAVATGASAIVSGLTIIVTGIISLIPAAMVALGEGIIALCGVIVQGAPAIGEAIKAIVLTIIDVLVQCIPDIAEGALLLVVGVIDALVSYTPQIVDGLFQFLITVIDTFAARLPELIQSVVNLFMSFFSGVVDALKGIDTSTLIQGIAGVGIISAIVLALAAIAAVVPAAMLGVLGMGVIIAELMVMLAAVGGIAQIPGLDWLISEGGNFLGIIGTAIGKFIGGIAGGIMSGVTSQFPQIGSDLAAFMINATPFIDGVKKLDSSAIEGVNALVGIVLALTAANILDGLTSWLTGGTSMVKFGEELAKFGPYFKQYCDAVRGIDPTVVEASANAALALAQMASNLPNSGGMVSWFTGDNDLETFGKNLTKFGEALKKYSEKIKGINISSLSTATACLDSLVKMAKGMSGVDFDGLSGFSKALGKLGKSGITDFVKAFETAGPEVETAVQNLIGKAISGVTSKTKALTTAFTNMVSDAISGLKNKYQLFHSAGGYLVSGFAAGISDNTYKAEAKAKAMASAAYTAAKNELQVNSPSKVFRTLGKSIPEGFAMGIGMLSKDIKQSSVSMADGAIDTVKGAITRVASIFDNGEIETQPTIRPILDLSDIRDGARSIGSILGSGSSVGVLSNLGAIGSIMAHGQNGGNDDIVKALDRINSKLDNAGSTINNINGITYDDSSNLHGAIAQIVRAAKIERRS